MRAANGNNVQKFMQYVRRHDPVLVRMVLEELKVEKDFAQAIVTSSYRFRGGGEIETDRECHVWVRVRGQWYYDKFRSLSPDAVVAPGPRPTGPCQTD